MASLASAITLVSIDFDTQVGRFPRLAYAMGLLPFFCIALAGEMRARAADFIVANMSHDTRELGGMKIDGQYVLESES